MKKLTFLTTIFFVIASQMHGQQLPLFTQYTEIQNFLNPAAISIDYLQYNQHQTAGVTYRLQWMGLEDSPQTGLARYEYIREAENLTTFGASILQDQVGPTLLTGFYGKYSYQLRPSMNGNFLVGIGLSAGIFQYRLKASELEFQPDDMLQGNNQNEWLPDFGIGLNFTYYPESGTKFYAGVSIPQIAGLEADFKTVSDSEISIKRLQHFYASGGAILPIGQQGFLEPSVWVKYVKNAPLNIDFNLRQKFVNNFWMGLGYGTSNTLHVEMGLILTELIGLTDSVLRIGYGFNYNLASHGAVLGSSHELSVSYAWSK